MKRKYRCVFLDRDGVINKKAPEGDYIKNWGEFKFLPNVKETIKRLNKAGFLVIIITNQQGIAKGLMAEEDLKDIHTQMSKELKKSGAKIDGIYYCPHGEKDNCICRKPKPGMFLNAIKDFKSRGIEIDLEKSYMMGDSEKDIIAGKIMGLKTIKLGKYLKEVDIVKDNLLDAVREIILND